MPTKNLLFNIDFFTGRAHNIVSDGGMCPPDEARTLAADLLLQDFICLAIVNPERYGVTGDLPITETSRINLIQIAQHLQRAVIAPGRHNGGTVYISNLRSPRVNLGQSFSTSLKEKSDNFNKSKFLKKMLFVIFL